MDKFLKKLSKYRVEMVLIISAFLIASVSLFVYINSEKLPEFSQNIVPENEPVEMKIPSEIYVDMSGAVNLPDLYKASNGERLKDLIKRAGGLSPDADTYFFARNFNLSRFVADQEKIYIPTVNDVSNGYFIDSPQTVNSFSSPSVQNSAAEITGLISINSAGIEELDTLPGVGKVTAQKIIDNRPFKALEELTEKKILTKTIYGNVLKLIRL